MSVSPCTALFLKKRSIAGREREWRPGTFELPTLCLEGEGQQRDAGTLNLNSSRHARAAQAEREERDGAGEDYCSKIKMAGARSVMEATTNFDAEITYRTPLPAMFPAMVPLPFVRDEEME